MLFSGGNDLSDVKVSVVRMQGLPYRASEDDIVRIRFLSVNFSPYFNTFAQVMVSKASVTNYGA